MLTEICIKSAMFRSLSLKAVRRVVGEEALKANGVTLPLPINEVLSPFLPGFSPASEEARSSHEGMEHNEDKDRLKHSFAQIPSSSSKS